jgi:hypothetical protein
MGVLMRVLLLVWSCEPSRLLLIESVVGVLDSGTGGCEFPRDCGREELSERIMVLPIRYTRWGRLLVAVLELAPPFPAAASSSFSLM